jgi:hypothetical protein
MLKIFASNSPARARWILNLLAVAILLAGYTGAALIWRAQDRLDQQKANQPANEADPLSSLDSRTDTRQIELLYGESGVVSARWMQWLNHMTHGKPLARMMVVLSSAAAILCLFVAGRRRSLNRPTLLAFLIGLCSAVNASGADADDQPAATTVTNGHYGLFNWLDHRSAYTQEVFPEPFLIDDMALEDNELEFTWAHSKGRATQTDLGSVEYQKGLGLLTLEAEIPFESIETAGRTVQGLGLLELGARYPLYQYVSAHRMFDVTFGPALECGIPLQLRIDGNTELEPLAFCALRIGDHFTAQTTAGYDVLFGPGHDGGERSYEFGTSLAYAIPHQQLPLPGVQTFFPMFELSNELGLNKDEQGKNDFEGDAGFRVKFNSFGEFQPNLGVSYVFPFDRVARDELHWGCIVSLIFEF